jgi:hypothetical protein
MNIAYLHLKIEQPTIILSDVILTAIGFCQIGLFLYLPAKLIGGKGKFGDCMLTGFYLAALWPIALLADYLGMASPWVTKLRLSGWDWSTVSAPTAMDMIYITATVIVGTGLCLWLAIKTVPVIKKLHSIGVLRSMAVLFLGYLLSRLSKLGFRFVKEKRPSIC